jgi:hypothetical protein
VPGEVAVERPDAGIVSDELHYNERRGSILLGLLKDLSVTAIGVAWIGDGAVPGAETFRKDLVYFLLASFTTLGREIPTIMTVQVHGMSNEGKVIVDDQANRAITAKIVDIPRGSLAKIPGMSIAYSYHSGCGFNCPSLALRSSALL